MAKVKDLFTKPQWEGIKRVARIVVFFLVSEVITQMLDQLAQVPDFWFIRIGWFNFSIAVRESFRTGLTLALSYVDTKKYMEWKILHPRSGKSGGLVKW